MKYLVTYIYDEFVKKNCFNYEICNSIDSVNTSIKHIKKHGFLLDRGMNHRNIKVYQKDTKSYTAEEITEQFDTKTKFDEE